jgi:hypothetical protein
MKEIYIIIKLMMRKNTYLIISLILIMTSNWNMTSDFKAEDPTIVKINKTGVIASVTTVAFGSVTAYKILQSPSTSHDDLPQKNQNSLLTHPDDTNPTHHQENDNKVISSNNDFYKTDLINKIINLTNIFITQQKKIIFNENSIMDLVHGYDDFDLMDKNFLRITYKKSDLLVFDSFFIRIFPNGNVKMELKSSKWEMFKDKVQDPLYIALIQDKIIKDNLINNRENEFNCELKDLEMKTLEELYNFFNKL